MRKLLVRSAVGLAVPALTVTLALVLSGRDTHRGQVAQPLLLRSESAEFGRARSSFKFPQASPQPQFVDSAQNGFVPTFGQATIAGIQGTGFEPDIRLHPTNPNLIYVSVPAALSSDTSWIWHSRDGGKTFKWVPASIPKTGKSVACPGGGDTELAVDSGGHIYFNDLTLANFSVARSDDLGNTFPCNSTGVPSTLVDRQWYAIDGDPIAMEPSGGRANSLYLASNNVAQDPPPCEVSGAGNNILVVYRSLPGAAAGLGFGPPNHVTGINNCEEGIMGNIEVSPVATTTAKVGQPALSEPVHHVYVIHDDATFSKIKIGRCFPVPRLAVPPALADPSGLLCDDLLVRDLGPSSEVRTGANFPSLAIDKAGNLYAVWQQAPVDPAPAPFNEIVGDTSIQYSYSTDEGTTWSPPIQISPPQLKNNVMTWAEAGDDGRVDIAWYGTTATVTPPTDPTTCAASGVVPPPIPRGGPDFVNGVWYLYMNQTLNGHAATPVFTGPIQVGEHHVHRGPIATIMGGLCTDRTAMGDFFKLRIGAQGEANIIYSNSNSAGAAGIGQTMFIRQNGGPGVLTSPFAVTGDPIQLNAVTDPAGDGVRELNSPTGPVPNIPSLDILNSTVTKPAAADCHPAGTACYRVQTKLNNLNLVPPVEAVDPVLVWSTIWFTPADPACVPDPAELSPGACAKGGRKYHVYAESSANGTMFRCFFGENSVQALGGGVTQTYPPPPFGGQITAPGACVNTLGPNGTITIEVPIANVSLEPRFCPSPPCGSLPPLELDPDRLFSVTASTMTLQQPADTLLLGVLFDVIDVARSYDADFTPTAVAIRSFTATRSKQRLTLRWRTASESALVGFNVYRQRGNGRVRMNRAMITAAGDAFGHAYTWRGKAPSRAEARFWLQWVRTDGTKRWYGPARS